MGYDGFMVAILQIHHIIKLLREWKFRPKQYSVAPAGHPILLESIDARLFVEFVGGNETDRRLVVGSQVYWALWVLPKVAQLVVLQQVV